MKYASHVSWKPLRFRVNSTLVWDLCCHFRMGSINSFKFILWATNNKKQTSVAVIFLAHVKTSSCNYNKRFTSITVMSTFSRQLFKDGYRFLIMQIDPRTVNHISRCRQLFHQFMVDMYATNESERSLYVRLNQKKLRVDKYIHLRNAIANDGNADNLGQLVILPSSFTGSPRYMDEYTQDAMTYVRNYGRPDLFVTFTLLGYMDDLMFLFRFFHSVLIYGCFHVFLLSFFLSFPTRMVFSIYVASVGFFHVSFIVFGVRFFPCFGIYV